MRIFAVGDVVSKQGCDFLKKVLPKYKHEKKIDLVIANGENSASGNGILPSSANFLFDCGVDIITGGNHTFKRREIYDFLDENDNIIRPANFPNSVAGKGYTIYDSGRIKICVINLLGIVFLESLESPFIVADRILEEIKGEADIIIIDLHAEATSEKSAFAHYLDGRVSAIFGTHTHTQTSDAGILPNGTAFITDIGMTGPKFSCLGIDPSCVIKRFKTSLPTRFDVSDNPCVLNGVLMDFDLRVQSPTNCIKFDSVIID